MGIDYNSQGVTFDTKDSYGARLDTYGHDGPGNKIALDLLGRKHVERADNADGVYWLQKDTRSSLVVFPVPGASSADTFRKFLREHLPYSLITDEYGCAMPSEQISDDHLPALQTHLWRSGDDAITAFDTATREQEVQNCGPFIQHRSRMMPLDIHASMPADQVLLVAHYVRFIIALLESNHIFILPMNSKRACEFPNCQLDAATATSSPTIVTIEPLIHWGTVTPADNLLCCGRIMAFRRNGEKCEDPLWTLAIRKLTLPHSRTYCVGCLKMLMDNAPEIMVMVENRRAPSFTAINTPSTSMKVTKPQNNNNSRNILKDDGGSTRFPASGREAERHDSLGCSGDPAHIASLNLDGARDVQPIQERQAQCSGSVTGRHASSPLSSANALTCNPDSDGLLRDPSCSSTDNSPGFGKSFTPFTAMSPQCATAPDTQYDASTWATINDSSSSPWSLLKHINHCEGLQPTVNPNKPVSKNDSPRGSKTRASVKTSGATYTVPASRQGTRREFGRELDANTVIRPRNKFDGPLYDISMLGDYKGATDIRKLFKPALDMPSKLKEDAKVRSSKTNSPTKALEHSSEDSWETVDNEGSRETSSSSPERLPKQSSDDDWESTDTEGPGIWHDYLLHATKDDLSPPHKIKSILRKKSSPRSKNSKPAAAPKEMATGPFFAKRNAVNCPEGVSEPIWIAYQTRVPTPTEVICSCRKAGQTAELMIAQCSNRDCTIGWYHYDCLDKSGKISCRHGKLLCQYCKNKAHFKTQDALNKWTLEKLVKNEMTMALDGVEMAAAMPLQGGSYGIVNPYGLGTPAAEPLPPAKSAHAQGALGSLSFLGYEVSEPFNITGAYKNAHAYAHLREQAAAEEDEQAKDDYNQYEEKLYKYEEEEQYNEELGVDVEPMEGD